MKNLLQPFLVTALTMPCLAMAQNPFTTLDSINVGNINAAVAVHGDLWSRPSAHPMCEFPKNSGKHIAASGALWMGGFDNQHMLRTAGHIYRFTGVDYWPGPIGTAGSVTYTESQDWARIWKLNRSDLNSFLSQPTHTLTNTPATILEWPAIGNPYARGNNNVSLNITTDLAPFVDVNNDGNYNPLQGDYPVMKGDQMLWYVFNDNGPTHSSSKLMPCMVQVKCMAYAYGRNTLADNIIFYEYELTNRNSSPLDSFFIGAFGDLEIGNGFDDYAGCDTLRNMGIVYNADNADDAASGVGTYDTLIPKVALKVLKMPHDTCGQQTIAGSIMSWNNGSDVKLGDPTTSVEFYNYLTGSLRNGDTLKVTLPGGGEAATKYSLPDDPSLPGGFSACSLLFPPYDKRTLVSSQPFRFEPGQTIRYATALVASAPASNNGCPTTSFADIRTVADTAQFIFCNPLPVLTKVKEVAATRLSIYPNPAKDKLYIEAGNDQIESLSLTDQTGRIVEVRGNYLHSKIEVDISKLASGVYLITTTGNAGRKSAIFLKD